ncbi:hypothetical protein F9K84_05870 [Brucella anthropi]|nr:hypothetical protein F9K84_05870 [Brucella anthropi]
MSLRRISSGLSGPSRSHNGFLNSHTRLRHGRLSPDLSFTTPAGQVNGLCSADDISKLPKKPRNRAASIHKGHHNSVIMPSLGLELAGFVIEYSPKDKPPIFISKMYGAV